MTKIYISPSDQTENPYAWGNTNEGTQCNIIAEKLEKALNRCKAGEIKRNASMSISKAIAESNAWKATYHVCLHTNASADGAVAGTRMIYGQAGGPGHKACAAIMAVLAPITPGTSDNITQRSTLNEVRSVTGYTVYIEIGFHDNKTEARWIVEHTTEIAEAICEGLCNHLGVTYIPDNVQPVPEPTKKLYRVQVGAFSVKRNAEAMLAKLKAAGYADAFITN